MINKDTVVEMSELCMLNVSEEEAIMNSLNIQKMMDKIEGIKEVDTEGLLPCHNPNDKINPLRKDVVGESLDSKEVLKNTVEEQYGYFKILRVMD